MYAKCGEIECSRRVFDKYPGGNVVSWTSMIVGYVQNDRLGDGLALFNQMRECVVEPNEFTIGTLLTTCAKLDALHQGKWVHGYMISKGIDSNSFSVAALVDMYVKCGTVTDARLVFDGLITADLVPWTAMIVGYSQRNYPLEALALFTDRKWVGVMPNSVTITSVLSACAQSNSTGFGRSVHTLGIKLGLEDAFVANALVHMYAKCRMIKEASYIFDRISEKDVVSWNSMITGYSQNGFASEVLSLFCQMRYSYSLDPITMVSVLSACACVCAHKIGCALHAYSVKDGFLSSNVYVGTALLNLYSKFGDSESSHRVFDEMGDKNIVTWSAMMAGYGMHGDVTGSVTLFSETLKENLEPNEVVFTNILSACGHTGMVGEGWNFFQSMCKEYHVVPSMKHYVCMVDLLARAGKIEEAMDFIERIPIQPDERVWGALLHECRLHSRLDLGEVAARRMLELQPDCAGYYVLISNFFASDGRWTRLIS
ncbi:hypothetical protein GIB67_019661 [Kingdonia uniflora]|uniref:Pentatricopeptide repeat-containing protein n=1 Tax=Kingdonia uniflora TaxID=39325 RepID=A0A7J7MJN6_9MAGN|nr:hypothetical protein GIB67_019661 [Kingdonia uniflora]